MERPSYSIAKLKAGLSSILADVAKGTEILITDHNRPVARIVSIKRIAPLPAGDADALLAAPPVKLKRGAPSSAVLIRRLRDEGTY